MRYSVLLASLVLVAGAAGVVAQSHADATLAGEIEAVDGRCTDGNVTELTVAVDLQTDDPVAVTPHVWSARQHVQNSWSPERIRLEPGSQLVTITAPAPRADIRPGERAQVWFAHDQRRLIRNFEAGRCAG